MPTNPTTTPTSGWPALYGLEAYSPARPGIEGTLGAPGYPEVRGLLLEHKDGCVWLLTPKGVVTVPANGLRFADPGLAAFCLTRSAP